MADNVTANAGAGGATFATDDIGGVQYPRSKVVWGPDGTANDTDDASGKRLPVKIAELGSITLAVSNAGTFVTQIDGAALTALQLIDDIVVVDDAAYTPASGKGVVLFGMADMTSPDSVDEGDAGAVRMTLKRELLVSVRDAAGNDRGLNVDGSGNIGVTDAGGSLTVDGTVTANAGSGPWPVTDNGGSLTVDNGGTFAVQATGTVAHDADGTGANPVLAGGYASAAAPSDVSADGDAVRAWHLRNGAQAVVVTAAGALVGGDATNGMDVDVTRVIPGTSATHLGKAEDAAHNTGDTGVMSLAVRRDANTTLVDTDGDYAPLQVDASGSLKVAITAGAGSGGTASTDDAAFSVASGSGTPIMGLADQISPDSVDEGDVGVVRMSNNRNLFVTIRDSAGNERGLNVDGSGNIGVTDAGGSLTVDGTVTANAGSGPWPVTDNSGSLTVDNGGTFAVQPAGSVAHDGAGASVNPILVGGYASAAAPSDVSADNDAVRAWFLRNGALATVLTAAGALVGGDATNGLDVDVTRLPAVAGGAAQDAAITGNPVPVGYRASTATPSAMSADGDVVYPWATREGALVTVPAAHAVGGATPGRIIDFSISNQGSTVIKASAGKLTALFLTNTNAAVCYVKLYNKATGPTSSDTPVWTIPVPGNTAGAGIAVPLGAAGVNFSTGISIRATTAIADNSTAAVAASEVVANYAYA